MISFDEILEPSTADEKVPWNGKVDKNGRFYHAKTLTAGTQQPSAIS